MMFVCYHTRDVKKCFRFGTYKVYINQGIVYNLAGYEQFLKSSA